MTINNLNDFLNQQKKECKECRETKSYDHFRKHAGNKDGHDIYCKACRKLQYKRITADPNKRPPVHRNRSLDSLDRSKKVNFIRYMQQRPYYFQYVFNMEATEINIQKATQDLNMI